MHLSISFPLLPVEIITLVVAQINDQASLSHLARCSKLLNTLVTPYLYRVVTLYRVASLFGFSLHILKNAYLASCVRSFSIAFRVESNHPEVPLDQSSLSVYRALGTLSYKDEEQSQVMAKAVQAASHSEGDQMSWLAELYRGSHQSDALLALLLPALVNLEYLDTSFSGDSAYCFQMLQCNRDQKECVRKRVFGRLTHVRTSMVRVQAELLINSNQLVGFTYEELAFLLNIPSLRSFRGCFHHLKRVKLNDNPGHFVHGYPDAQLFARRSFDHVSSNLTHFELWNSRAHISQIKGVLKACHALQTFIFECKESSIDGSGNIWMSARWLSKELSIVSNSLEKVVLCTVNPKRLITSHRSRRMPSMTSLAGFPKLKDISLGAHYLLSANLVRVGEYRDWEDAPQIYFVCDLLPPTVQKFRLTQFCSASRMILAHIIRHIGDCSKERFPELKEIEVGFYSKHPGGDLAPWKDLEDFIQLQKFCSDVDISLTTVEEAAKIGHVLASYD